MRQSTDGIIRVENTKRREQSAEKKGRIQQWYTQGRNQRGHMHCRKHGALLLDMDVIGTAKYTNGVRRADTLAVQGWSTCGLMRMQHENSECRQGAPCPHSEEEISEV